MTLPVADNLLNQTFAPIRPNEAWVTDITYVATGEGWLYLAGIKEVFTCELVGYAMDERMTQTPTATALWKAVRNKRPAPGLIHHSDRGSAVLRPWLSKTGETVRQAAVHVA